MTTVDGKSALTRLQDAARNITVRRALAETDPGQTFPKIVVELTTDDTEDEACRELVARIGMEGQAVSVAAVVSLAERVPVEDYVTDRDR